MIHARVMRSCVAIAAAFAATLALVACGGSDGAIQSRFVAGDGALVVIEPTERVPAPDLSGTLLDGERFEPDALEGQVVVVNVWASWCAPCRTEAPALGQVARDTAAEGVQFVGLSTRDTQAAAEGFVRRFDLPYPNLYDPDATIQARFRDSLPPQAIPSTLFIDRQGRVAARVLGPIDRETLRDTVAKLSAEPGA